MCVDIREHVLASMRPQRFSCGIMRQLSRLSRRCRRFNEAAAFQLRNPNNLIEAQSGMGRFNEAAAFQLRNL